jgi:hypothetical protein
MRHQVLEIPQVDGGTRYIAVSAADAEAVEHDPAMVDGGITVLGCADVTRDGRVEWGGCGPRRVSPDVRGLILSEIRRGGDDDAAE